MGRAPCCDKANVKKGPWSPEEDAKLKAYIEQSGTGGNWIALPQKAGLRRCGKSCRLRWLNYLRPDIRHGGFTEEEDSIICNLYATIGSRWSIIAAQLPGRTDNDIKNYWNTRLKKKLLGRRKDHQARRLKAEEAAKSSVVVGSGAAPKGFYPNPEDLSMSMSMPVSSMNALRLMLMSAKNAHGSALSVSGGPLDMDPSVYAMANPGIPSSPLLQTTAAASMAAASELGILGFSGMEEESMPFENSAAAFRKALMWPEMELDPTQMAAYGSTVANSQLMSTVEAHVKVQEESLQHNSSNNGCCMDMNVKSEANNHLRNHALDYSCCSSSSEGNNNNCVPSPWFNASDDQHSSLSYEIPVNESLYWNAAAAASVPTENHQAQALAQPHYSSSSSAGGISDCLDYAYMMTAAPTLADAPTQFQGILHNAGGIIY